MHCKYCRFRKVTVTPKAANYEIRKYSNSASLLKKAVSATLQCVLNNQIEVRRKGEISINEPLKKITNQKDMFIT